MFQNFAFLDLGTPDLLIILAIVLLLFGGRKLPQISKSLSDSVRELRKGFSDDDKKENETPPKKDDSNSDQA